MSLLGSLASAVLGQNAGGLMEMAAKNPALMQAAGSLMSSQGGLQGLLGKFTEAGHGDAVQSWVGTGENQAISADAVSAALGGDMIAGLAAKAGLSGGDMSGMLAQVLPLLIDKATPNGQVGGPDQIMDLLGGLLKR